MEEVSCMLFPDHNTDLDRLKFFGFNGEQIRFAFAERKNYMYYLHVTYTAENREIACRFYDEVKRAGIIETTRNEPGNLRYEYFFSAERENEILLLEQWEDKASQIRHGKQPHFAELAEIKEKYEIKSFLEEL